MGGGSRAYSVVVIGGDRGNVIRILYFRHGDHCKSTSLNQTSNVVIWWWYLIHQSYNRTRN